jgi:hypothetical protein
MESAGQMPSNLVIGAMIQVTAAGSAGSSSEVDPIVQTIFGRI